MNHTRITFCNVKIVTPDLPYLPTETYEWDSLSNVGSLGSLVAVNVSTSLNSLVNSFSLTFAPEDIDSGSWVERIPQYSLVFIEMGSDGNDGDDPTVMVGLTGPPAVSEDFGAMQRQVTIPGRGIEAVLADAGIWLNPYLDTTALEAGSLLDRIAGSFQIEMLTGRLMYARNIFAGSFPGDPNATADPVDDIDPMKALIAILAYYLDNADTSIVNLVLPSSYLLRRLLVPGEMGEESYLLRPPIVPASWSLVHPQLRMAQTSIQPRQGPILGIIEQVIDKTFHDFFIRYERKAARMYHRVKPFVRPLSKAEAAAPTRNENSLAGLRAALDEAQIILDRASQQASSKVTVGVPTPDGLPAGLGKSQFAPNQATVRTITVLKRDLMGSQVRKGMQPIANAFTVFPGPLASLSNEAVKAYLPPVFSGRTSDFSYAGRYGIRPLEVQSPYMMFEKGTETDLDFFRNLSLDLARTLQSWIDPHPEMRQGTIRALGRSEYRTGDRLLLVDEDGERPTFEYHITGVSHSYSFADGAFVSSIDVERGWAISGGPAAG